ncbi:hypothetical protein SAMN05661096_01916 [Marivirga sericea]|uniref:Uncharacterized protein n=1 Tax=Marivirga sericea TaxID=1028 RepID=A0A1X7JNS4_9BACT|nr:hypothetical protein [Marivirga sericea]SMG29871.1 hypothetical protein SAMN05661096_01916 [Marivirga sericea]
MRRIILLISIFVVSLILFSLFTTENINSLEGDFKELAFERNENNTGPIQRVYVFSVNDTLWSEMNKHADLLPHTKYGTTEVYYFLKDDLSKDQLKLSLKGLNSSARQFCIAHVTKDGQSRVKFSKYPFK